MEKISSSWVMVIVKVKKELVEVDLLLGEAFSELFALLSFLNLHAFFTADAADVAKKVARLEFHGDDHVHAKDRTTFQLRLAWQERGCDQILDDGVGLGQQGGEIHLLPTESLLGLDAWVAEGFELRALEEVDDAIWLGMIVLSGFW